MINTFTFFSKYSHLLVGLNDRQQEKLVVAIWRYGALGIKPNLDKPLGAFFEAIRRDIDRSISKQSTAANREDNKHE